MRKLLTIAAAVFVAGCGGSGESIQEFMQRTDASLPRSVPPLPDLQVHAPVAYEGAGSRDPFSPERPRAPQVDNAPRTVLEQFPLDTLRMIGAIRRNSRTIALVRAPDGVVHLVTAGDRMGTARARATEITEGQITLAEPDADAPSNAPRIRTILLAEAVR